MDSVSSAMSVGTAEASVLRSADEDTAKAAFLLKKAMSADKDLVNTLMPQSGQSKQLDILA
jgi:hypothetical protein